MPQDVHKDERSGKPVSGRRRGDRTSMKIAPRNGRIEVVFENLEAFPISIDVFRE